MDYFIAHLQQLIAISGYFFDFIGLSILFWSGGFDPNFRKSQTEIQNLKSRIEGMQLFTELDHSRNFQTISTGAHGEPVIGMTLPPSFNGSSMITSSQGKLNDLEKAHKKKYNTIYLLAESYWPLRGYFFCLFGLALQLATYFIK